MLPRHWIMLERLVLTHASSNKVHEGRPHIQDRIKNGEYDYIVNTTAGRQAIEDSKLIRRSALRVIKSTMTRR